MVISVIIPTFNEERTISQTLANTVGLGVDQIIVVDGGSRDQTVDIAKVQLKTFTTVSMMSLESVRGRGRARQMNSGAAAAKGEILIFVHADTLLPPDARSAIEAALQSPDCVGGRFDVRFKDDQGFPWLISRMMNLRSRWTGIATGDQAIFVRRSVFQQLGGFSDIPIMEDIDFSYRMKRLGSVAALESRVMTSYRRWERKGPVRTILLMWALRFLYWIGFPPKTIRHFYGTVR